MKVISDIAEETYPAIAFQIKDYRREMEKIREEILGSVEKGSSLDEILSRMSTRRGFLISTLVIAGMVLAACNHLSTSDPTATATPFQPQVTETSPAYETPGVTETPFVEVTPTEETAVPTEILQEGEISPERKAEIVSNVNAFINAEGRFSDEELRKSPYWFELDEDPNKLLPLGMLDYDYAQMILVDYFYSGEKIQYFLGGLDTNGERIVIDLAIDTISIPGFSESQSNLYTTKGKLFPFEAYNDNYFKELDENIANPMMFVIQYTEVYEVLDQTAINNIISKGWDPERVRQVRVLMNQSREYYRDIFALLYKDNIDSRLQQPTKEKQVDQEMSVTYFNIDNQMTQDDFSILDSEPSYALNMFYVRRP